MDLPILIYGSKDGCPACVRFDHEWKEVCRRLENKARLIKFNCTAQKPAPKPLRRYFTWFPSIMIAEPESYFKCFTVDDQVNEKEWSEDNVINGIKFNAVETPTGYDFAGRPNTAENVISWFEENAT